MVTIVNKFTSTDHGYACQTVLSSIKPLQEHVCTLDQTYITQSCIQIQEVYTLELTHMEKNITFTTNMPKNTDLHKVCFPTITI